MKRLQMVMYACLMALVLAIAGCGGASSNDAAQASKSSASAATVQQNYSGDYAGTVSGGISGSWKITVSETGIAAGTLNAGNDQTIFAGVGRVKPDGAIKITFGIQQAEVVLSGAIASDGAMQGICYNRTQTLDGRFNGEKLKEYPELNEPKATKSSVYGCSGFPCTDPSQSQADALFTKIENLLPQYFYPKTTTYSDVSGFDTIYVRFYDNYYSTGLATYKGYLFYAIYDEWYIYDTLDQANKDFCSNACWGNTSTLNQGLVAYYPFNGNANDASGYANHGTVYGATLTTDRFGNRNSAYSFNGSNNYIKISNSSVLNFNSAMTISFWVKPQVVGASRGILSKKASDSQNGYVVYFDGHYNEKPNFRFKGTTGGEDFLPANSIFNLGYWQHWVVTYDFTGVKWYKNGTLDKQYSYLDTSGSMASGTDLHIGHAQTWDYYGHPTYFNGAIDDVRLYNRALSGYEILQLYQAY